MSLPVNNKGFALFVSIFIILAFSTIALLCFNLLTVQDDAFVRYLQSIRAEYLAWAAKNLFYEYYAPWGADFTIAEQFPVKTWELGGNQFKISYSAYGSYTGSPSQRQARVHFKGTAQPISRTFYQDVDAQFKPNSAGQCAVTDRSCLSRDLKNFVLNVYNPNSFKTIRMGGEGFAGNPDVMEIAGGCLCAGGAPTYCATYSRFFEAQGDIYIDNCLTRFRIGKIGTSTKPRNLYVRQGNIEIFECAKVYGTVYHNTGNLECYEMGRGSGVWSVYCVRYPQIDCSNHCWNQDSGCCSDSCGSDGLWPAPLPKPLPSKPEIHYTYFTKQLELAGDKPKISSNVTLSGDLGKRSYFYNNKDTSYEISIGDVTGGPANIVATGKIVTTRKNISEKINIISGSNLQISGDSSGKAIIGGVYESDTVTGVGSLIYAQDSIEIIGDVRVKARLISPGFVSTSTPSAFNSKIWGIIYTNHIKKNAIDPLFIYGSVFVDLPSPEERYGLTLNLSEDGDNNSNLFLPLKVRGLYNLTSSNWQEQ